LNLSFDVFDVTHAGPLALRWACTRACPQLPIDPARQRPGLDGASHQPTPTDRPLQTPGWTHRPATALPTPPQPDLISPARGLLQGGGPTLSINDSARHSPLHTVIRRPADDS
jgi:hypothetical protein